VKGYNKSDKSNDFIVGQVVAGGKDCQQGTGRSDDGQTIRDRVVADTVTGCVLVVEAHSWRFNGLPVKVRNSRRESHNVNKSAGESDVSAS
jgi:hypothetical protein